MLNLWRAFCSIFVYQDPRPAIYARYRRECIKALDLHDPGKYNRTAVEDLGDGELGMLHDTLSARGWIQREF